MARENRSRRSTANIGQNTAAGPRERSQLIRHVVPEHQSSAKGLEALQAGFANFFNQGISAVETLAEAQHKDNLEEIRQENDRQIAKGAADALSGDYDPDLENDLDYQNSYEKALGKKMAGDARPELAAFLENLSPEENIDTAVQDWMDQNWGDGTDSDIVNTSFLASIQPTVEEHKLAHTRKQTAFQIEKGVRNLFGGVTTRVQSGEYITADWFAGQAQAYRNLDPARAHEAPLHVMRMIVDAAKNDERSLAMVDGFIHNEPVAPGGKTLAEYYPDQMDAISEAMLTKSMTFANLRASESLRDISDHLDNSSSVQDYTEALGMLALHREQYGLKGYDPMMGRIHSGLNALAKSQVAANEYILALNGQQTDGTYANAVNKGQQQSFKDRGLDVMSGDASQLSQIASEVVRVGNLNTSDASRASAGLVSPDTETRVRAYHAFAQIAAVYGDDIDRVLPMIRGDRAAEIFQEVHRREALGGENVENIFASIAERGATRLNPKDVTFAWATGEKNDADGKAKVLESIKGHIESKIDPASFFDREVTISPSIQNEMMDLVRQRVGDVNDPEKYEDLAGDVVDFMLARGRVQLMPGFDNKLNLMPHRRLFDEAGEEIPALGFAVRDPKDPRRLVNTITRARQVMDELPEVLPALGDYDRGDELQITLPANIQSGNSGAYHIVDRANRPIVVGVGQPITIGNETIRINNDPKLAQRYLRAYLKNFPDLVFEPITDPTTGKPGAYQFMYRPSWQRTGEDASKIIQDRLLRYVPKLPNTDNVFGTGAIGGA